MKKYLLIVIAALLLCSCEHTTTVYSKSGYSWEVIEIDSCEYINGYNRLTHKGNCKYCQERNRKMIKDIIEPEEPIDKEVED